ncbi:MULTISPECIES: DUF2812 domain-containing protein [Bacillus cereus group]|uniref:Uncharacterized protein n=1 Tax=Bacillus paranthracis TaxID=2026186 RepID=A0A1J9YUB9_9BACI|nr:MULTISPECIES: DUF2812 domain-containing protein [Bacillus cereus group]EJR46951.1 hypothetical protein IIK_03791 [Bacillus cereus VD102]ONG67474.1 hypothetical protein BKK44_19470 [Bacillus cereus]OUA62155.1 hypothetical protein BK786_27730 [Bacillus thuringiensis serovar thailandensis]MCC2375253.1 DUF2812 domain-containing protein [Bacillus paranthracis]MCC2502389.1 DUF2812 domain-containing protein [Bacillus paranthracis]
MMWKLKFFLDFEKEEKWLEEMAWRGYQLESDTFGYTFRYTEPEDATIKIDHRVFSRKSDFINYCTLFEDSGWEHIAGNWWSGTHYFKKVNEESEDDIFSDQMSRAGKYKRLSKTFLELAICSIPILILFMFNDTIHLGALANPKELYFTPGLWDKQGVSFLWAFLFETPLALMRGFAWLFIPVAIVMYLVCSYKAHRLYEERR